MSCHCSSPWWPPSRRTSSGFCSSAAAWWWSASFRLQPFLHYPPLQTHFSFCPSHDLPCLRSRWSCCTPSAVPSCSTSRSRCQRTRPSTSSTSSKSSCGFRSCASSPASSPSSSSSWSATNDTVPSRWIIALSLLTVLSGQPTVMRRWHHFVFQSYVLLAIVIFLPYISQCLKWCRSKAIGRHQTGSWKLIKRRFGCDSRWIVLVTKLKS